MRFSLNVNDIELLIKGFLNGNLKIIISVSNVSVGNFACIKATAFSSI